MTGGPLARLLARLRPPGNRAPAPAARATSDPASAVARLAPPGSDWVWRPGAFHAPHEAARVVPGVRLGDGLSLFHDCPAMDLTLTVIPRPDAPDATAHAFAVTVGAFTGTYLSLVADLPGPVAASLTHRNLIGVRARIGLSGPSDVYLRLNLRHGPNTETQVRKAPDPSGTGHTGDADLRVDFDLAPMAFDADRLTAAWVDIIVGSPAGQRIDLGDLVLSRRLRAML